MKPFAITHVKVNLPYLGVRHIELGREPSAQSFATVLIGRNGSGKSSLLREILSLLRGGASSVGVRARSWQMIEEISIAVAGERLVLSKENRASASSLHEFLPTKIIALSFTPFDKFPARDDTVNSPDPSGFSDQAPFYVYLGFKNESGRSSPKARLMKTLDTLAFKHVHGQIDERVCKTLSAIGYQPRMEISYTLRPGLRDYLKRRHRSAVDLNRGPEFEREATMFDDLALSHFFPRLSLEERLRYHFDFEAGWHSGDIDPYLLRELVKYNLINTSTVTLYQQTGMAVDLLELSSGELNILSGFLGLAAHLEEGSLVLIDEPENSLHPEWQIRYIEMLEAVLREHAGCQYIITTHSPLVLSGAASTAPLMARLDKDPVQLNANMIADASPDATLLTAFDVVTSRNNYLKQLVLEGLTLIENGEAGGDRSKAIVNFLAKIRDQIPSDDPIKEVVDALVSRVS